MKYRTKRVTTNEYGVKRVETWALRTGSDRLGDADSSVQIHVTVGSEENGPLGKTELDADEVPDDVLQELRDDLQKRFEEIRYVRDQLGYGFTKEDN